MTIYYLRHEHRPMNDSTFHTELTDKGKEAARTSLKTLLLQLDIKKVYCSPFIRCQQTIHPFIKRSGLSVNVENCLQEVFWDPKFQEFPLAELDYEQEKLYNVNKDYSSILPPNTLSYPENTVSVRKRVKIFAEFLKKKNFSDNVLVCTHMGIVNILLSEMCEKIERDEETFYDMGKVSKIVNNELVILN